MPNAKLAAIVAALNIARDEHAARGYDVSRVSIGVNPFEDNVRLADDNGCYDWRMGLKDQPYRTCSGCPTRATESIAAYVEIGKSPARSIGHIAFATGSAGVVEFFVRDGSVYRTPASACIMSDGYRCGRWECTLQHWSHYSPTILGAFDFFTIAA
jgi:hypothetical protein